MRISVATMVVGTIFLVAGLAQTPAPTPNSPGTISLTQQEQLVLHNLTVIQGWTAEREQRAQMALDDAKTAAKEARERGDAQILQIKQSHQCGECEMRVEEGRVVLVRSVQPAPPAQTKVGAGAGKEKK
jgi:hypothetical protein